MLAEGFGLDAESFIVRFNKFWQKGISELDGINAIDFEFSFQPTL